MSIGLSQNDEEILIQLEGALDIGSAAELKAALLLAVEARKAIVVSLGQNTGFDVTVFQLLWAAKQEAERTSVRFALEGQVAEHAQSLLADAGLDVPTLLSSRIQRQEVG